MASTGQNVIAVLYGAKSTLDHNESASSQHTELRAAIEREGWCLACDEFYFDEDSSGYRGSRGPRLIAAQLLAAKLASEGHDVRLIAVASDRFARGDGVVATHYVERVLEAHKAGYALWTVSEREQANDLVFGAMFGQRGNHDSAVKADHVRRGVNRRFYEKKLPLGKPVRGQRVVKWIEDDGKTVKSRLEIDPLAQPHVEAGARMWIEQDASFDEICRYWNGRGFLKFNGREWTAPDVSKLFRRSQMSGWQVRGNGERVDVPAVLPPDLARRVQAKFAATAGSPRSRCGRTPKALHLFHRTSVPLRSACGGTYTANREHYRCNRAAPASCGCPSLPRSIDQQFLTMLLERHIDGEATRRAHEQAALSETAAITAQIEQTRRMIRETEAAIDRAATDYRAGDLSAKRYEQLADRLDRDLLQSSQRLDQLTLDFDMVSGQQTNAVTDAVREHLESIRAAVAGSGDSDISPQVVGTVRAAIRDLFETVSAKVSDGVIRIVPKLKPELMGFATATFAHETVDHVQVFKVENFDQDGGRSIPRVPLAISTSASESADSDARPSPLTEATFQVSVPLERVS